MHPTPLRHTLQAANRQSIDSLSRGRINGTVEKKNDNENYVIKSSSGTFSVKIKNGELSEGDNVVLSFTSSGIRLEKAGRQFDNVVLSAQDEYTGAASSGEKFRMLFTSFKESIQTGNESAILKNASAMLDLIKNSEPGSIDILQLRSLVDEATKLLAQRNNSSDPLSKVLTELINTISSALTSAQETGTVFSRILQPADNLMAGLFSPGTLSEALSLLNIKKDSGDTEDMLRAIFDKYGKIILKISGSVSSGFLATALTGENLSQEIKSIIAGFKSPMLQSLPPEALRTVLDANRYVSESSLNDLDNLVQEMTSRFPKERAGSRSAAVMSAAGWLSGSLDMIKTGVSIAAQAPTHEAGIIPDEISKLRNLIQQSALRIQSGYTDGGITEEMFSANSREKIIPLSVSNLGLDLESSLLKSGGPVHDGIKSQLLSIANRTVAIDSFQIQADMLKVRNAIDDSLRATADTIDRINKISSSGKNISDINKAIGNENAPLLDKLLQLRDVLKTLSDAGVIQSDLSKQLENLMKVPAAKPELTYNTLTEIRTVLGLIAQNIDNRNIQTDRNSVNSVPEQAPDTELQKMQHEMQAELQLKIRHSAETALNRLESLQLLARQLPTTEGEQQMLALPMKIADEWTEVNIRFIKKDDTKGKKKAAGSNFTVYLNLSPKNLGNVSVKMDYVLKKSLRISMEIEQDSTRNFFNKFSDQIKNAIAKLGLPVFSIDIRKLTEKNSISEKSSVEQLIDVKV